MTKDHMTAEERAGAIVGVRDPGGPCAPSSKIALARSIVQAIREAENAAYERAAGMLDEQSGDWAKFGAKFPECRWVDDYSSHLGEAAELVRFLKSKDSP